MKTRAVQLGFLSSMVIVALVMIYGSVIASTEESLQSTKVTIGFEWLVGILVSGLIAWIGFTHKMILDFKEAVAKSIEESGLRHSALKAEVSAIKAGGTEPLKEAFSQIHDVTKAVADLTGLVAALNERCAIANHTEPLKK